MKAPENSKPRLPWFPFYPADWLTSEGVNGLTRTQRSYYLDLLCLAWRNQASLPGDSAAIRRHMNATYRAWCAHIKPVIERHFVPHPDDPTRIVNARQYADYLKQLDRFLKAVESARIGVKKRSERSANAPANAPANGGEKQKQKQNKRTSKDMTPTEGVAPPDKPPQPPTGDDASSSAAASGAPHDDHPPPAPSGPPALKVIPGRGMVLRTSRVRPPVQAASRSRGTAPVRPAQPASGPTGESAPPLPPGQPPHSKPAMPKKREPRETWLTPYWDVWRERYGGNPDAGHLAKYVHPLHEEHGLETTLRRFRNYLASMEASYVSLPRFASTFGSWDVPCVPGLPPGVKPDDRVFDANGELTEAGRKVMGQ